MAVPGKFKDHGIFPAPRLGVAIGKRKRAALEVAAGGPVPPAPVARRPDTQAPVVNQNATAT